MARLRPYLIRGTYEWIVDHDMTPYILVDAEQENVEVPWEYVEEGRIVLNASPVAIQDLHLDNDFIRFQASFGGQAWQIFIPASAVLALYARETGQGVYAREDGLGMMVNEGETEDDLDPTPDDSNTSSGPAKKSDDKKGKGRGGLRLVK